MGTFASHVPGILPDQQSGSTAAPLIQEDQDTSEIGLKKCDAGMIAIGCKSGVVLDRALSVVGSAPLQGWKYWQRQHQEQEGGAPLASRYVPAFTKP